MIKLQSQSGIYKNMRPDYEFLHDDRRANIAMQGRFALPKLCQCQHIWAPRCRNYKAGKVSVKSPQTSSIDLPRTLVLLY